MAFTRPARFDSHRPAPVHDQEGIAARTRFVPALHLLKRNLHAHVYVVFLRHAIRVVYFV